MNELRERWAYERESIDCVALARMLIGREPDKSDGKYASWCCPFHDERTPSFKVTVGRGGRWRCFGACAVGGDAADLIQRMLNVDFLEARAQLLGVKVFNPQGNRNESVNLRETIHNEKAAAAPKGRASLTEMEAEAFHAQSRKALGSDRGSPAKDYLAARGIGALAIERANLGYAVPSAVREERLPWKGRAPGIVIPWYRFGCLCRLNLRVDETFRAGRSEPPPKYLDLWRHPDKRFAPLIYPEARPHPFRPGLPVIITEGEFDCILLTQELAGMECMVVTMGAASQITGHDGMLKAEARDLLSACGRWFIATDADDAGEEAASRFMLDPTARRIMPPSNQNDWTDAKRNGVNLREFFAEELRWTGVE